MAMIDARRLTPVPALLVESAIGLALLAISDITVLITYWGFAQTVVYFLAVAGLLKLRWQRPKMDRPIKVSFRPIKNWPIFLPAIHSKFLFS